MIQSLNLLMILLKQLMYLPPYSPDLNPIEKKWAQVKYWYKRFKDRFENKREFLEMLLNRKEYTSLI